MSLLNTVLNDVLHGLRLLRRSPGFALMAVLSLAIGIGANTALFSLLQTVLLRPLPVDRPHELVFVRMSGQARTERAPPYPLFQRIARDVSAFAGIAAFAADELRVVVNGSVEQVYGQIASGTYFDVLGLQPVAGRLLNVDDERLDPPVAVVDLAYAQRRFGGASAAIGPFHFAATHSRLSALPPALSRD